MLEGTLACPTADTHVQDPVSADVETLANREQLDATAPLSAAAIYDCAAPWARQRPPPRSPPTARIRSCLFRRKRTLASKRLQQPPSLSAFHESTRRSHQRRLLKAFSPWSSGQQVSGAALCIACNEPDRNLQLQLHPPQSPLRLVPSLHAFPDRGSDRSTASLVPRRRKAGLFQGAAPRTHPISLRPLRSVSTPPPSGRRAARSAPLSTVTVGGSATLPPACGCACSAQRYPAPATDAPTCRNALAAGRTRPNRCARTARTSSMGGMCRPGRARFQDALEARRAGGIR